MNCRVLALEGICIKGQFNLLAFQIGKLRPREGDTVAKVTEQDKGQVGFGTSTLVPTLALLPVTRPLPGALSPQVCNELVCPHSSLKNEKTELDHEDQIRLTSFILETWLSLEMARLWARN